MMVGMNWRWASIVFAAIGLSLVVWFLVWSLVPDGVISEYDFSVLGDSLRSLGGIAAVAAASVAAWVAYHTNETRRAEAIRSNFKDRMQWAVEHLSSERHIEQLYALNLLEALSKDPDLDDIDNDLVQSILDTHKRSIKEEEEGAGGATAWRPWKLHRSRR
ncbi:MAG: hypothetical protein SPI83_07475 [Rothia sp. (in: high G+C Gram-positive bacteria)]|nr:hypothetical protein [Rothia sp. (in: high G+C Gram-positive bacteria)]